MTCKTKMGKGYINDYIFLFKGKDCKVERFQKSWDPRQAYEILLS